MADRTLRVSIVGDERDLLRSFKKSTAAANRFGQSVDKSGASVKGNLKNLAGGYVGVTAGALAFGAAAKASFSELFESQKVAAQTEAVLKSTGRAANVSADDVDKLAQSLLRVSGVDDELIKSGENLLLTFTSIRNEFGKGNDIFNQATRATLDMAVAMGEDMTSAAIRVGKALNDPVRGMTALRRVGVQFTREQEKQIKALVKAGDTLAAQKLILQELNREFGGSARAAGETLPGQLSKLRESAKNLGATVAGIATPALIKFTESANTLLVAIQNLNDPRKGLPGFKDFFKGLGENLPSGVEAVPTIGPFLGALKLAFHKAGKDSAKLFIAGLNAELQPGKINTAGAEGIVEFFKKQIAKRFGTGTPFIDLGQAQAEATKKLTDDLAVSLRRIVVLRERLSKATGLKEQTDLQNAVNAERDRAQAIRDQIQARKDAVREAAKERRERAREAAQEAARKAKAARERAKTKRDARQFGLLGLGPTGGEKIPGVKGLQKRLGSITQAVKGTFLDTSKTKSLLANIGKILAEGIKNVSPEVRAAIKGLLDDISDALKKGTNALETKFRKQSTNALVAGLGLTPEQQRELRGRLSQRGKGGLVATGPNRSAFGVPVQPRRQRGRGGIGVESARPIQVNLVVSGRTLAQVLLPELQKEARRRSGKTRGPNAGVVLGTG